MVDVNFTAADKVTPVVKKMKAEVDSLGKSVQRAGQSFARMGGAGGGIIGRALGGFGQGTGAGLLGLSAAGAGLAINGIMAASDRNAEMARQRFETQRRMDDAIRSARDQTMARHASAVSQVDEARKWKATTASQAFLVKDLVKRFDAKQSLSAAMQITSPDQIKALTAAESAALTGEVSLDKATTIALKLQRQGVLSAEGVLLESRGQIATDENLSAAGTTIKNARDFAASREGENLAGAVFAENRGQSRGFESLFSGAARDSLKSGNFAADNPEKAANDKIVAELMNSIAAQKAAADAAWIFAEAVRARAALIGYGEGSEIEKLQKMQTQLDVVTGGR